MLSSISWQHYLAAVFILTASYYLYLLLRYYQKEIAHLFNLQPKQSNIFSDVFSAPVSVMGAAKLDHGVSISETEDLQFIESVPDEIENLTTSSSEPSKELVMEAGNLIEAFKDIDNKPEFLSLLKILIGSYQRFQEEIDFPFTLNSILEISKEKLLFSIDLRDLQNASA